MKPYYLLRDEYEHLLEKKQDLQKQMNEIGQVLGEVTSQSGETRHDNAGYDEAIRTMSMLVSRSKEIDTILINISIVAKSTQKDLVQIGSSVTLQFNDKETKLLLGGSHTMPKRVSYLSPLGQALIGKSCGAEGVIVVNGQRRPRKITNIDI
ncbi:MAG: GreA/GreB family elongation factor [Candidatus Absconditabacterales bacterium]